jgi:putative flavoprotein involved in K+ transport
MKRTDVVVIGGGQAGLAMSRCLGERGIEHVVLERGKVGERWRSERWDSLRLLTPRWQSRLPGWSYSGPDPGGFMTRGEVIRYLDDYARSFAAPVESGVTVLSVAPQAGGYRVVTDRCAWWAPNVVIATGHCERPHVPSFAADLSGDIRQVVTTAYRNPDRLSEGGVLVVGASATGAQLAAEIHASGRPVTLAVGRHTRLPRHYRGRDIMEWFERLGILSESAADVPDLEAARRTPSMQLIGSPDHHTLDLRVLRGMGVRLAGRAVSGAGNRIRFADDLEATIASADRKLRRLLGRIDAHIRATGLDAPPPEPILPVEAPPAPAELDLAAEGVRTVLWATGFRRDYSWLHVPVIDARGEIRHEGGIVSEPGLYVLGLRFLRRRNSNFLDGVGADATELAKHIEQRLAGLVHAVA